ncbi:FG-GAP-like repeat-containing protein [Candidatus Poribacteria bacterium]
MLAIMRSSNLFSRPLRNFPGYVLCIWFATSLLVLPNTVIVSDGLADIAFTNITEQAGIDNPAKGACVALVDYDGDGYVDIYVGNSGSFLEPLGKPNILYRNNGDGTFTDMAVEVGIADERQSQGVAFGDLDNDGDPDLYVANDFGVNALYINNGDGTFEDITEAAGVKGAIDIIGGEEAPNGYGAALADTDNDGYLDIYVINLGGANILYHNNGDGTFTDSTAQMDIGAGSGMLGAGTAAVFSDGNGDGRLDLYAVNGYGLSSFFYLNSDTGLGDATDKAGIGEQDDAEGAVFGDYDNDGDMDLYVSNTASVEGAPLPDVLYRNDGSGVFEDVTEEAGVSFEDYSLGAVFGDVDNDGYLDLYVVINGGPNILYHNNGDGTFTDITAEAGVGDEGFGSNAALGDIDSDGYLDIYVANTGFGDENVGDPDVLYRNNGGDNHWLQVQLRSATGSWGGIGARIAISAGDLHQVREISGGRGYAQNSSIASFGLGAHTVANSLQVTWPSGVIQTLKNVSADELITIDESDPAAVQPHDSLLSSWGEAKRVNPFSSEGVSDLAASALGQNYPNPFNPETWIPYRLARSSDVIITVYNSVGQLVRELDLGYRLAGVYSSQGRAAYWDGRNDSGEKAASGIYFYRIQAGEFIATKKMVVTK